MVSFFPVPLLCLYVLLFCDRQMLSRTRLRFNAELNCKADTPQRHGVCQAASAANGDPIAPGPAHRGLITLYADTASPACCSGAIVSSCRQECTDKLELAAV